MRQNARKPASARKSVIMHFRVTKQMRLALAKAGKISGRTVSGEVEQRLNRDMRERGELNLCQACGGTGLKE